MMNDVDISNYLMGMPDCDLPPVAPDETVKKVWDEFFETGEETDEAVLERRLERVAMCGKLFWGVRSRDGSKRWYTSHCDDWHLCEICRARRTEKIRSMVSLAVSTGDTWVVRCKTGDETARVATSGGKETYLSFPTEPQPDGYDLVIITDHAVPGAEKITIGDMPSLDVETMALTPRGRRMTGKLRQKQVAPVSDGETVTVLNLVAPDAPMSEIDAAYVEAVIETADEDPKTPEEVEQSIYRRVVAWGNALKRRGYHVTYISTREKLTVIGDWVANTNYFLAEVAKRENSKPKGKIFPS